MAEGFSLAESLTECEASPSYQNVLRLVHGVISLNVHLADRYWTSRIHTVCLNFFDSSRSQKKNNAVLEAVVCWLEQQDDPDSVPPSINVPDQDFLERLCDAVGDLPSACVARNKLWFLRIFNSADITMSIHEYYASIQWVADVVEKVFADGVPMSRLAEPFMRRQFQDPVRSIRYGYISALVLELHPLSSSADSRLSYVIGKRNLSKALDVQHSINPFRVHHADALFFLRLKLRSMLARLSLTLRNYTTALFHLSTSANEQCLRLFVVGEVGGYRQFLLKVATDPMDVALPALSRLFDEGVVIPALGLWDFVIFIVARAFLMRNGRNVEGGRAFLEMGRTNFVKFNPQVHFPHENSKKRALYSHALICLEYVLESYPQR
jgi:hypothetical protein